MFSSIFRRLILLVSVIVIFFIGLVVVYSTTFSANDFVKQKLANSGLAALADQPFTVTGLLQSEFTWENVVIDTEQLYFTADKLSAELNLMAIIIGQPQIKSVNIVSPVLEFKSLAPSFKLLHTPFNLGAQRIAARNGFLIFNDAEVQDIELSMLKNGSLGEYSVQTKGRWLADQKEISYNYSGMLGTDNDNKLFISRSDLTAQASIEQWLGSLTARLRNFTVSTENEIAIEFASWSSTWQADKDYLTGPLDFAGGIDAAQGTWEDLRMGSVEAALAYRDANQWAHTVSTQATNSQWTDGKLSGQLGFTILTEKQSDVSADDWQSFNFVIYGTIADNQPLLNWQKPDVRIAYINGEQQKISQNLEMRALSIDVEQARWQMLDGVWVELLDETVTGDFGYALLEGSWPNLAIDTGPSVSKQLQPALNLLIDDLEFLRALYADVVQ